MGFQKNLDMIVNQRDMWDWAVEVGVSRLNTLDLFDGCLVMFSKSFGVE